MSIMAAFEVLPCLSTEHGKNTKQKYNLNTKAFWILFIQPFEMRVWVVHVKARIVVVLRFGSYKCTFSAVLYAQTCNITLIAQVVAYYGS